MDTEPPPVPATTAERRKRRWLRRALWGIAIVLVLLWIVKVPLLNWALRRVAGDYDISVTGVHPRFVGAVLSGVRVVHRPTGRQLGYAKEAEVAGNWLTMIKGELQSVSLSQAEVVWRPEFETITVIPLVPGPPATPILTWQHGEVRDGVFSWYERGKETPRLSLKITRLDGGPMAIYNDGTVEAGGQAVVLDDVVSREFALDETLEIESRSPRVEGVITAQHNENRYTVESMKLAAPQLNMVWRRGQPATLLTPEPAGPPLPDWYHPAAFVIREGIADPAPVMFTVHSPDNAPVEFLAALTRLRVVGLRAGGALPFIIAAADGRFENMKAPGATMEAREMTFAGKWDERSRIHITSAAVNGAAITDSNRLLASLGFSPEETKSLPLCSTGVDAKCVNLVISGEGIASADSQDILLKNFSALMPGNKEPVAKAERVEIRAVPDESLTDKRLRSVTVHRPEVQLQKSQLPNSLQPFSSPGKREPPAAEDAKPEWHGWRADALTIHEGRFKATDLGVGIPDASGSFSVLTAPRDDGGDPFYRIHLDDLAFENPILPTIPLKTGGVMEVDIHPVRFWDQAEIDEVRVNGHKVELNEAFIKLFEGGDEEQPPTPDTGQQPPDNPQPPPDKPTTSRWKVRRLVVSDSEVAVDDVGAGRRLVIPIRRQVFENVPLSAGMLGHDSTHAIQKVEVPAVYLYAPFHEGITVAELPVNFIYFSFAGLMEKRLERVELLFPKIKAGSPLFQFIEVMKSKFSSAAAAGKSVERAWPPASALHSDPAENFSAPAAGLRDLFAPFLNSVLSAATMQVSTGQADTPAPPAPPAPAAPVLSVEAAAVWDIPFFVETGEIITAPNGIEWPEIPHLQFRNARVREGPDKGKPIPFRLHGEEAHGELAIKPGWYDFPEYKVRLRMSDEGRVVFNFPLKDRDNNLVEVFRNNTVIYRDLVVEKVWLSVTYDQQGIYIGLGGETCGGYINAKINLYLDPLYSWDASASLTGVNVKPLTGRLTREYVLMEGKVDVLNVTAYGDMTGLHQTTATLKMPGKGKLQVKALDELRRKFVDGRVDWADDFGRISVDTLRLFDFTSCEGTARLFGHEGTVRLFFNGPSGKRDVIINLHDYRKRPEKSVIRF
jgi:hypothetical protein